MKAILILHDKYIRPNGNIVEVKIWKIKSAKSKSYKYSLVYIANGKRVIGYDNAEGKGHHRHYKNHEQKYEFKDLTTLINDFYKEIGKLEGEINES